MPDALSRMFEKDPGIPSVPDPTITAAVDTEILATTEDAWLRSVLLKSRTTFDDLPIGES